MRRLGRNARCRVCGAPDLAALTRDAGGIICYECAAAANGRATVEWHHPTGWNLNPDTTVGVPGNLHRVLDDMKQSWPEEVRRNVARNPLLTVVAHVLAERDWANARGDAWQQLADWLQRLNAWLAESHGEAWWDEVGIPPLWEKDE